MILGRAAARVIDARIAELEARLEARWEERCRLCQSYNDHKPPHAQLKKVDQAMIEDAMRRLNEGIELNVIAEDWAVSPDLLSCALSNYVTRH